jgi:hypothetical protein
MESLTYNKVYGYTTTRIHINISKNIGITLYTCVSLRITPFIINSRIEIIDRVTRSSLWDQ